MVFCNAKNILAKDKHEPSHNPYFSRWFSAINESEDNCIPTRKVTILILVDGFLQYNMGYLLDIPYVVTILILVDGFLQWGDYEIYKKMVKVTILILVDGFLQYNPEEMFIKRTRGHNPYFSRWFSAMMSLKQ